jgi:hypothetical protein
MVDIDSVTSDVGKFVFVCIIAVIAVMVLAQTSDNAANNTSENSGPLGGLMGKTQLPITQGVGLLATGITVYGAYILLKHLDVL